MEQKEIIIVCIGIGLTFIVVAITFYFRSGIFN